MRTAVLLLRGLAMPHIGKAPDIQWPGAFIVRGLALQSQFLDDVLASAPAVYYPQDETDVHTNAALQCGVETDVTSHGLPVAVECKAWQLSSWIF